MKSFKPVILLIAVLAFISFNSCKKAAVVGCGTANYNYAVELQDESAAVSAAAQAYGTDQSSANCNAYIDALNDYLDAAEDIDDCVPVGSKDDYRAAIDASRQSLDGVQC